ncbi:hypothetical protein AAFN60_19200 [Roseibacillus persicicus]|uniref:hypothetical protein n=1 Tax=Roseibacillus persicicus TaxID=454148 RepID=UPI00398ABE79
MKARENKHTSKVRGLLFGEADVIWANGHRAEVLAYLRLTFPRPQYRDQVEDAFQNLLLRIWKKGIRIVNGKTLRILKFYAHREMIDIIRKLNRKKSYPQGGIIDMENLKERKVLSSNPMEGTALVVAFCDEFHVEIEASIARMSRQQQAIANSLIRQSMFEPTARQIFEGMTDEERTAFDTESSGQNEVSKEILVRRISRRAAEVQKRLCEEVTGRREGHDSKVD